MFVRIHRKDIILAWFNYCLPSRRSSTLFKFVFFFKLLRFYKQLNNENLLKSYYQSIKHFNELLVLISWITISSELIFCINFISNWNVITYNEVFLKKHFSICQMNETTISKLIILIIYLYEWIGIELFHE